MLPVTGLRAVRAVAEREPVVGGVAGMERAAPTAAATEPAVPSAGVILLGKDRVAGLKDGVAGLTGRRPGAMEVALVDRAVALVDVAMSLAVRRAEVGATGGVKLPRGRRRGDGACVPAPPSEAAVPKARREKFRGVLGRFRGTVRPTTLAEVGSSAIARGTRLGSGRGLTWSPGEDGGFMPKVPARASSAEACPKLPVMGGPAPWAVRARARRAAAPPSGRARRAGVPGVRVQGSPLAPSRLGGGALPVKGCVSSNPRAVARSGDVPGPLLRARSGAKLGTEMAAVAQKVPRAGTAQVGRRPEAGARTYPATSGSPRWAGEEV